MPYRLRKAPNRNLYWVVGEDGTKHSKDPIPRERAEAQIRALYASENGSKKKELKGGFRTTGILRRYWDELRRLSPQNLPADHFAQYNTTREALVNQRHQGRQAQKINLINGFLTNEMMYILNQNPADADLLRNITDLANRYDNEIIALTQNPRRPVPIRDAFVANPINVAPAPPIPAPQYLHRVWRGRHWVDNIPRVPSFSQRGITDVPADVMDSIEMDELPAGTPVVYTPNSVMPVVRESTVRDKYANRDDFLRQARALPDYGTTLRGNVGSGRHHQLELLKKKLEGAGLRGSGFFDTLWKVANKVKEYVVPAVKHIQQNASAYAEAANAITSLATPGKLNPSSQRWLAENENYDVVGLTARRAPVGSWIEFFFSLLTEGKWDEAKKKIGYDKMFHLALGLTLRKPDGSLKESKIEKLSQPNFTDDVKADKGLETMPIPVPQPIKVGELIRRTQVAMGDKFYSYNAFANNCQNFVMAILDANGLATPEIRGFVYQPVDELLKEQPEWTENFSKSITNLGGITDRIFQGYGNLRGCKANHHNASSMKIGGAKFIRVMLPEKKKV